MKCLERRHIGHMEEKGWNIASFIHALRPLTAAQEFNRSYIPNENQSQDPRSVPRLACKDYLETRVRYRGDRLSLVRGASLPRRILYVLASVYTGNTPRFAPRPLSELVRAT